MSKFITFMGETKQNDKAQKASEDVVCLLNKTNNTRTIKVNSNGDACLFGDDEMLLQIGTGKSSRGEYLDAYLFYGEEEESSQSFDFNTYEEYICHVCDMINDVYNKKIKIGIYAEKWKCYGKKYYVLNDDGDWLEYKAFEIKHTIFRVFFRKTYTREKIYDFRVKGESQLC